MPIYEYRCNQCGFEKEYLQKIGDDIFSTCPDCGQESFDKLISAVGFQLKGTGWYATDFKNKMPSAAAPKETSSTDTAGGETTTSTSSVESSSSATKEGKEGKASTTTTNAKKSAESK